MALNIRLSPALDSDARAYCERVGISLNSLVGVALDAYLRQPAKVVPAAPVVAAASVAPAPAATPSPRSAKPVLTAAALAPVVRIESDPKPILGPKPSKAERSKLAAWHQRNR